MATCRGASNGPCETISGTSGMDMVARESCTAVRFTPS